ncbi:insecticidal toxin complex protein TcaA [Photorhabdus akhurstii]|uniref:Insecticidal toxin complex protein TcaA n=1 Tax=Photorhabdus akhurstii TaxID=171438 RepID=A0ABX8LYJ6_9GAMM|nr:insecticidal toxin complex protein TcaA [Photorhabdus akhurstii]QXF35579.1 insecticidal toxin complex protein TcaA [Photorhabdus akhurstii]
MVTVMQNKISFLSGTSEQPLLDAGYQNVFDIASISRATFVQSVPTLSVKEAHTVYRQARQRAENLKSLYRAWQLRQEPVIKGLAKLNPQSNVSVLQDALVENIGGDGDFSDLMNRASQYADAASIQSLFSPGRYASALYRVAKDLHKSDSSLHIDNRRADLKDLILSETTMNKEVTSLDILLDVLQKGGKDITELSSAFFPMTLPYDDHLSQIDSALSAQARTLNGVWNTLTDTTAQAVSEQTDNTNTRKLFAAQDGNQDTFFAGNTFYFKAVGFSGQPMVYLSQYTSGNGIVGAQLIAGNPDQAAAAIVAPLKLTWSMAKQCYYLGAPDGTKMGDGNVLTGCFLRGNSSTNPDQDGIFAQVANKSGSTQPLPSFHLPVTLERSQDKDKYYLKTDKGYIAVDSSGQSNWKNALVLNGTKDNGLLLIFCSDSSGTPTNPDDVIPPAINNIPSPPARETLSLTPVSYQLMTNPAPTEDDITNHYGFNGASLRASPLSTSELTSKLNSIDTFCEKTRLSFNQLMDLTAQQSYSQSSIDAKAASRYVRFGETTPTRVNVYGAAYLNSTLADAADGQYLWIQTDGKSLNFTDDTVVALAGRAEKLVRLSSQTGLSFEELDWLIANTSRSVPDHHDKIVLDKPVLEALAEYVNLKQRYGLDANTFATFISAVNPYTPDQTPSFYETAFRSADGNHVIALGTEVKYAENEQDKLAAICCKALGVTSDELFRIGRYCFGNAGSFTLDEYTASQLYRFGAIPRLFGLTFAQAEILWRLMEGGKDILLQQLGQAKSLQPLAILRRTEQVLDWMSSVNLSLTYLQGMVSTQWSGTATAEMFNFLENVCDSVNSQAATKETMDSALQQKVLRALSAGFGIKSNVMGIVTFWLEKITIGSDNPFTLANYWHDIQTLFSHDNATLDSLQTDTSLVIATQQLSQLVLIVKWLSLTEQDLQLLTTYPERLINGITNVPVPNPELLLTLSRFKQWQTQVTVSRDEAMRCFDQLNANDMTTENAASLIATLHEMDKGTVAQVNTLLLGENNWPKSFTSLWQLLTWLRVGQSLNVGSITLGNLLAMMQADPAAESSALLASVAQNLSAAISNRQ